MGTTATVVRKLFVLLLGEGAARILGVATFALLARALGLADLGVFSFGMSLALVLECVMDFGQNAQLGRVVAQDPKAGLFQFTHAASNKTLIAIALSAVVAAVMYFGRFSTQETLTVLLLLVWAAGLSVLDSLRSAARSLERFRLDSTVNGAESFLRLSAVLLVWALGGKLVHFGIAFAIESWIAVFVAWAYLGKKHDALLKPPANAGDLRRFLRQSAPFGIAVMSLSAFYNLDQVFVRTIVGAASNGLYGAAARVSFTASVVGSLLAMVAYPDLARMRDDLAAFRRYLGRAVALAGAVGLSAATLVFIWAGPLLTLLFGAKFAAADSLLRVLAIVIVFRGISTVALYAANALGRSRQIAIVAIVFTVCNVTANVVLLPRYGAAAAAWISAVGEIALASALLAVSFNRSRTTAPDARVEVVPSARG
ncbi:MAG: oligosaccharide flippase family protein [Actinomycetota bacterium]|nr:MAG: polysaccharide biosynthesis [Actinomycetota bacterium]MDO8949900.1 oligosaccharide flippase family protein [Actinomycetota bacterium]MDP3631135.1 oligosaccharide flippase family protein [Actinomycetota bacterium]